MLSVWRVRCSVRCGLDAVTCSQGRQVRLCLPCHHEKKKKGDNKIKQVLYLSSGPCFQFNFVWFLCILIIFIVKIAGIPTLLTRSSVFPVQIQGRDNVRQALAEPLLQRAKSLTNCIERALWRACCHFCVCFQCDV